jgi:hypothetical protein
VRRIWLTVLPLLVMAATAAPAHGQVAFVFDVSGAGPAHLLGADLEATGDVTAEFSGDRAAGCEAAGNCDVSGVVVWTPSRSGTLVAVQYVHRRRIHTSGLMDLTGFDSADSGAVAAVRRGDAGNCSDVGASVGGGSLEDRPGRALLLSPVTAGSADPFDTRCPGPLAEDLRGSLPRVSLPFNRIRRGTFIDLSGTHPFAAAGLSGTVRSTLALRVTAVQRVDGRNTPPAPRSPKRNLMRTVFSSYRVDQVAGRVPIDYSGLPGTGACAALDSCGVTGTMALETRSGGGTMTLAATGPARRGRKDFLTALGLARGGNPRGLRVAGYGFWAGDGTTTTEAVRPGAPACRDSAPLSGGLLEAQPGRSTALFSYESSDGSGSPRTRCPGPLLGAAFEPARLATGTLPLRQLARPLAAVHMRTGTELSDDGYSMRTRPDLSVALELLKVRSYTFPGGY